MRFLLSFLILISGCASAHAQVRKLTILHTNDLHARLLPDDKGLGGFAYLATLLRQQRASCPECIFLNAGDLVQGTPVSTLFRGMPVYEIANRLKIDVSTLGNHEFDYGWQQVGAFMRKAKFTTVSANVLDGGGKLLIGKPYVIRRVNGIRVGVIGAVMGNLISGFLKPSGAGPIKVLPVAETVSKYAKELRDRTDIIIALGHILPPEGDEILEKVPEVNVVIEGHVHTGQPFKESDGRMSKGCKGYGVELCRMDLEVNVAEKKLVSWKHSSIPVDSKTIQPARDVQKQVAKWEEKVSKVVDVEIAESKRAFTPRELVPVIEQATLDQMQADFTLMNGGGVRDGLPQGVIRARNIWNIMPFDNTVMVAKVRGSAVPDAMRKNRTVDPQREYKIAVNDFVGTNPAILKQLGFTDVKFEDTGIEFRTMLIQWFTKKKIIE